MAESSGPAQADLDKCVHCGLCLNACPTYRELGIEMDSPRGRIYQMNQVASGAPITESYIHHLDLCLACRGLNSLPVGSSLWPAELKRRARADPRARNTLAACPLGARSGVRKTAAFAHEPSDRRVLPYLYQVSGLQRLVRLTGVLKLFGNLSNLEALTPNAEAPFFYSKSARLSPPSASVAIGLVSRRMHRQCRVRTIK